MKIESLHSSINMPRVLPENRNGLGHHLSYACFGIAPKVHQGKLLTKSIVWHMEK